MTLFKITSEFPQGRELSEAEILAGTDKGKQQEQEQQAAAAPAEGGWVGGGCDYGLGFDMLV